MFANLDSLSPPVVTTLQPGRDVAYPACRRGGTDMVLVRWAPRGTLPGPQDLGWTYVDALDLRRAAAVLQPDPPRRRRAPDG